MARKPSSSSAPSSAFDLSDSPGHMLRRAQQYAYDLFAQEMGDSSLTPRQFAVLLTVEQNEGLSQTDLVRRTGIDRSTLADMIGRLMKRGLLDRKRTEEDARANSVKITADGRKELKAAMDLVKKAEDKILEPVPVAKRNDFMKSLKTIAEAADKLEAASMAAAAPKPPAAPKAKAAPKKKAAAKKAPAPKKAAPAPKKKAAAKKAPAAKKKSAIARG